MRRPNILFLMTDQQRFDTIAALGNPIIYTPNLDRLVARGVAFTNAYSTCPVCVPARYTVMSGCEPPTTGVWKNMSYPDMHRTIAERCGSYLPATLDGHGYRTFGVGKFHTIPWDAPLGFELQLHSEELYADADARSRDLIAIAKHFPNVWVDMCWAWSVDRYTSTDFVRRFLHAVPTNKLFGFGRRHNLAHRGRRLFDPGAARSRAGARSRGR